MPRPRSEFLGSLGKLFACFQKVANQVLALGGNDNDIAKIDSDDESLAKEIARLITGKAKIVECIPCQHGFSIEKVGDQIICIAWEQNRKIYRYRLGQSILARDCIHVEDGQLGFIVELEHPHFQGRTDYVLLVSFQNTNHKFYVKPSKLELPTPDESTH